MAPAVAGQFAEDERQLDDALVDLVAAAKELDRRIEVGGVLLREKEFPNQALEGESWHVVVL